MGNVRLGLIAHDGKKQELVSLLKRYRDELAGFDLVARRDTGKLTEARTGLSVRLMESAMRGGEQQVGAMVVDGSLDAVVFLLDPMRIVGCDAGAVALQRACDLYDVPFASNRATAEAVLARLSTEAGVREGGPLALLSGVSARLEG